MDVPARPGRRGPNRDLRRGPRVPPRARLVFAALRGAAASDVPAGTEAFTSRRRRDRAHDRDPIRTSLTTYARSPRGAVAGLIVLLLAYVAIRSYLARKVAAPQLMCDEFIYAGIAKSLASNGHFAFRHEPNTVSLVYPALDRACVVGDSMQTAYDLAKAINASVMTLAAIPFFFWARRLSSPLYALAATALLLVLPAFDYTAMLMTENAFFPAVVAATYAIARSLERPTIAAQLLVVGAIVVALAVRAQAAALVLVLPTAVLFNAALDRGTTSTGTWSRLTRALKEHWVASAGSPASASSTARSL